MNGINLVILMGKVAAKPRFTKTKQGILCANFTLITSRKVDGRMYIEKHPVSAYDKLADTVKLYVKENSLVYIEGRLQTTILKNGVSAIPITEVLANKVLTLEGWGRPIDNTLTVVLNEEE